MNEDIGTSPLLFQVARLIERGSSIRPRSFFHRGIYNDCGNDVRSRAKFSTPPDLDPEKRKSGKGKSNEIILPPRHLAGEIQVAFYRPSASSFYWAFSLFLRADFDFLAWREEEG